MGLGWVHWGSGGVKVNFSWGPSINFLGVGAIHKLHGGHPQVDGLGSRFGLGGAMGRPWWVRSRPLVKTSKYQVNLGLRKKSVFSSGKC